MISCTQGYTTGFLLLFLFCIVVVCVFGGGGVSWMDFFPSPTAGPVCIRTAFCVYRSSTKTKRQQLVNASNSSVCLVCVCVCVCVHVCVCVCVCVCMCVCKTIFGFHLFNWVIFFLASIYFVTVSVRYELKLKLHGLNFTVYSFDACIPSYIPSYIPSCIPSCIPS